MTSNLKSPKRKALYVALLLAFIGVTAPSYAYSAAASNRQVFNMNSDWKYLSGDPSDHPESCDYEDSAWEKVNVPHCFNIPYWMERIGFGGVGWYRKAFTVDAASLSKRLFIEFEGAFLHTWIYVNGTFVGEHKGGYTGFSFDITDHVRFGKKNTIAVKVSSEWDPQIAPRAGDYVFMGGLYRDVYLVATDPLHVTWYGTFVTTPFGGALISQKFSLPTAYDSAPVNVKTEIKNDSDEAKSCSVKTIIVDADGEIVVTSKSSEKIESGNIYEFSQDLQVNEPHFWSPDDPYLYKVYTEVYDKDGLVDTYESPLGIRWIQATAHEGFWLNGKHISLHGFNVHQDHAGWATAVTNAGFYRDIKLMKDTGANFIRGSHYPKDPALIQACDRLGMCLMQEAPYWGKGGGNGASASPAVDSPDFAPFKENVEMQLTEMIRISRNNPSVIVWSLLNETTGGELTTTPLHELAQKLDPTRPTCRVTNFSEGTADIYGRNGWYPEKSDEAPVMFTELWEKEEYRPGSYEARPDPEAYYCLASAKWAGFDYGTHQDWMNQPGRPLNLVGACDNYRVPKRKYYFYRENWLGVKPPEFPTPGTVAKLQLTTDKKLIGNDGTDDCQIMVQVQDAAGKHISNNIDVTLKIVSGPGSFPTGSSVDLKTPDGLAAIEFRAYEKGTTVIKAVSNGIDSQLLKITVVEGGIQEYPKPAQWPADAILPRPKGRNIATNKQVQASSEEQWNPATNAIDGNLSTRWCATSGSLGEWWKIDLGQNCEITGIGITFEQYANYQFVVDVSRNGQIWNTVADHSKSTSFAKERFICFERNARYVRVTYTGLPEGSWASHFEVRVFSTDAAEPRPAGTNIATNKQARASTEEEWNPARNAVDGNVSTRWCAASGSLGEWWKVDLGKEYDLTGVGIVFERSDKYQFVVDISNNSTTWTTVADHSASTSSAMQRYVRFNKKARYVRITYTGLPGGVWASHYEVQVFSDAKAASD